MLGSFGLSLHHVGITTELFILQSFQAPVKSTPNLDVYICLLAYNFSGQGFYMFFMTSLAVLQ